MSTLKPAQVVKAKVTLVAPHGIHLRSGHHDAEIVVHVTDVPWATEIAPDEYARPGDVLEVTILRVMPIEGLAAGWLPWPSSEPRRASPAR